MKGNIVCVKLNRKTQHEGISMYVLSILLYILSAVVHTTHFFFMASERITRLIACENICMSHYMIDPSLIFRSTMMSKYE